MSRFTEFASVIVTLTPVLNATGQIQYQADTIFQEEEFLSEPQPAADRGNRFMALNGANSQVIFNYATNGSRDFQIFDSPVSDALLGWALRNPMVIFDFTFQYQGTQQDISTIRKQFHKNCFIKNTPARVMSRDTSVIRFNLDYESLAVLDSDGAPVGQ